MMLIRSFVHYCLSVWFNRSDYIMIFGYCVWVAQLLRSWCTYVQFPHRIMLFMSPTHFHHRTYTYEPKMEAWCHEGSCLMWRVCLQWGRVVSGCFMRCMSGSGWGGTSSLRLSLCCLSPPLRCQDACPAQMIVEWVSAVSSRKSLNPQRDVEATHSPLVWNMDGLSLSVMWAQQRNCSLFWDLIGELWRTFCHCVWTASLRVCVCVCVFARRVCDQGTCCKIAGKWHPFKHKGPTGAFILHLRTHAHSMHDRVAVNRIQSAAAFCQSLCVDSSLWGSSKKPFHREQWSMPFSLLTPDAPHAATKDTHTHTCTHNEAIWKWCLRW